MAAPAEHLALSQRGARGEDRSGIAEVVILGNVAPAVTRLE